MCDIKCLVSHASSVWFLVNRLIVDTKCSRSVALSPRMCVWQVTDHILIIHRQQKLQPVFCCTDFTGVLIRKGNWCTCILYITMKNVSPCVNWYMKKMKKMFELLVYVNFYAWYLYLIWFLVWSLYYVWLLFSDLCHTSCLPTAGSIRSLSYGHVCLLFVFTNR
jgi:hypothetical protein